MPKKTKSKKASFICNRCTLPFKSKDELKKHSQRHMKAMEEISLLEKGQTPQESKLGQEFKGRNKVIIS